MAATKTCDGTVSAVASAMAEATKEMGQRQPPMLPGQHPPQSGGRDPPSLDCRDDGGHCGGGNGGNSGGGESSNRDGVNAHNQHHRGSLGEKIGRVMTATVS